MATTNFRLHVPEKCPHCGCSGQVKLEHTITGQDVVIRWVCTACNHDWAVKPGELGPPNQAQLTRQTAPRVAVAFLAHWFAQRKDGTIAPMPLTPDEMADMIETLKRLCAEAQALQKRLARAMADQARQNLPAESTDRRKGDSSHQRFFAAWT